MTIFNRVRLYLNNFYKPNSGNLRLMVLWLIYLSWSMSRKCRDGIFYSGFNSRTIAEYFRRRGAQIGEDCDISVTSLGTEPYLVSIGNHVFISKGVDFHTHDGGVWILRNKAPGIRVYGLITIEDNCIIGQNAVILPNVHIGRNSVVGAGSVVISDIPPNSIVMGVPARIISSISKYETKCLDKWNVQKLPDLNIEKDPEWWHFKDNQRKLREHLTDLFAQQRKSEEETGKQI